MANNITIKDSAGLTKIINTIEDSVSAHYNMSIPINVSGLPIFTTVAPGIVCVAGTLPVSLSGTAKVSISPTQANIPVSIGTIPTHAVTQSGSWAVSVSDKVSVAGRVSVDNIVAVAQSGSWAVSVSDKVSVAGRVSVDNIVAVTQSGSTPWLVSVGGNVSLSDNAPVSVRGGVLGAVSIGSGLAQIGRVSVFVDQVPFNVSINNSLPVPVSIVGGRVSLQGISQVSVAGDVSVQQSGQWAVTINSALPAGTAHIGRVSVFVDQVPFNVSINNSLPVPVSIVGGRVSIQGISQVSVAGQVTVAPLSNTGAAVPSGAFYMGGTDGTNLRGLLTDTAGALAITSIKDDVSLAPQTLIVHVCNAAPGGGGGSPQVSIGGPVSTQAGQQAWTDGTNARTPLTNAAGNPLVHVCNALDLSGVTVSANLATVSIGGPVSVQGMQVVGRDTAGNARSPLMFTDGTLLVHVCNAAPGGGGGSPQVSIGGAVSVQGTQVVGRDTAGNARSPLMFTDGTLLVHVCNAAPGAAGGSSITVSVGGAVSVQAIPIAGSDGTNARLILTDVMGTSKVGGFTINPEYVFTRPTDVAPYAVGDTVANSTVAGTVVPMSFPVSRLTGGGGSFMIRRARLITATDNRTTDRSYRLHIFNTDTGVSSLGDNAVFSPSPVSTYAGYIDIPMHLSASTGAAGVGVPGGGSDINIQLATGQVSISALLEARTSILPASGATYRLFLEILQD